MIKSFARWHAQFIFLDILFFKHINDRLVLLFALSHSKLVNIVGGSQPQHIIKSKWSHRRACAKHPSFVDGLNVSNALDIQLHPCI